MEESRLKPMVSNYDVSLFNKLYHKTAPLRKKLTSEIDHRRFGLAYEDVLSFFDTKFIYVFNKYHDQPESILLAYLLNSLKTFKCRILRAAYTTKNSQSIVSVDQMLDLEEDLHLADESHNDNRDYYYEQMMRFMKSCLSENAYTLLEIQFNPPHYIITRMQARGCENTQKIPEDLLLEYFDISVSEKGIKFLHRLKKEIREAVKLAKIHFSKAS